MSISHIKNNKIRKLLVILTFIPFFIVMLIYNLSKALNETIEDFLLDYKTAWKGVFDE